MSLNKEVKYTIALFSGILIMIIAGFSYSLYSLNENMQELKQDYTNQILTLNKNFIETLGSVREDLEDSIFSLKTNLTRKIDYFENNLNNFREENKKEINTLNSLIEQIEEQSSIQLQELKDEVANIQVKSSDFSGIIEEVMQSVVSIGTESGIGSGAIIDPKGFIVTNYHVVEDKNVIRVLTYSGFIEDAALIGYNKEIDVAVLKINKQGLDYLRYDDSDDVKVGERVIALGSPVGLSFSATEGIVSAVDRKGTSNLPIYIQHDVSINPGNSGGPLLNSKGKIIGINDHKISGYEALGFAIESNTVKEITDSIIKSYYNQTQ